MRAVALGTGRVTALLPLFVTAVVATSLATTVVAQAPAVVLAVVEQEHLWPVASFGAAGWAAWPIGAASLTLPETWMAVTSGGVPRSVRVASAAGAGECAVLRDLRTGSATGASASSPLDVETRGVALSGAARLAVVSAVDPVAVPRAVLAAIERVFRTREQEQRLSVTNLATTPIDIAHVFSTPAAAGVDVLYFEAIKHVPDPRPDAVVDADDDPKGTLTIAVSGWLRADGAAVTSVATKAEVGWAQDDRRAARSSPRAVRSERVDPALRPLGVVLTSGTSVWVMSESAATGGRVALYNVGASTVRRLLTAEPARCL